MKQTIQWRRTLAAACMMLSSVGLSFSASAVADASGIKIGIVNTERILRESAPAVKAQKKIEKEFSPRDQELQKTAKQAKVLQDQLEKEGITMPETDRRNKERDLANLNREYQRAQRQVREDLSLRQNEEFAAILERANKAIQVIAEAEKYDLILQLQDSVYRSPRIDITDKVIKALADK